MKKTQSLLLNGRQCRSTDVVVKLSFVLRRVNTTSWNFFYWIKPFYDRVQFWLVNSRYRGSITNRVRYNTERSLF